MSLNATKHLQGTDAWKCEWLQGVGGTWVHVRSLYKSRGTWQTSVSIVGGAKGGASYVMLCPYCSEGGTARLRVALVGGVKGENIPRIGPVI